MDRAAAEAGLVSCLQAVYPLLDDEAEARRRLGEAFAVEVDGIAFAVEVDGTGLDELADGCGVAEAALTALDRAGVPHAGTGVTLQGLGTMGGATARSSRARAAVADVKGTIANPAGLAIEALLAARDSHGTVDRAAPRRPRTVGRRPAVGRHGRARGRLVRDRRRQPGADHRPLGRRGGQRARTTGRGAAAGRRTRVTVQPDVVVNSGTSAWWWTLLGDIGADAEEAFAHTRRSMRSLVERMPARALADGTTPRAAPTHSWRTGRPSQRNGSAGTADGRRGSRPPCRTGRIHTSGGCTRVCRVTA